MPPRTHTLTAAFLTSAVLCLASACERAPKPEVIEATPMKPNPRKKRVSIPPSDQTIDQGYSPLRGTYRARLGKDDHINSKGKPLDTAEAIVVQDRANVHRFEKRDPEDQIDDVFDDIKERKKLPEMARRALSGKPGLVQKIVSGEPMIEVKIFEETIGSKSYFLDIKLVTP